MAQEIAAEAVTNSLNTIAICWLAATLAVRRAASDELLEATVTVRIRP